MNRSTIDCAILALRVIRNSLGEPSRHFSREVQEVHRAEVVAALAELEHLPAPPRPDWSQAPPWANWWTVDAEGVSFWYEEEPICVATVTYCGWHPKCINGIQQGEMTWIDAIDIPLGIDWRTLKEQRP